MQWNYIKANFVQILRADSWHGMYEIGPYFVYVLCIYFAWESICMPKTKDKAVGPTKWMKSVYQFVADLIFCELVYRFNVISQPYQWSALFLAGARTISVPFFVFEMHGAKHDRALNMKMMCGIGNIWCICPQSTLCTLQKSNKYHLPANFFLIEYFAYRIHEI